MAWAEDVPLAQPDHTDDGLLHAALAPAAIRPHGCLPGAGGGAQKLRGPRSSLVSLSGVCLPVAAVCAGLAVRRARTAGQFLVTYLPAGRYDIVTAQEFLGGCDIKATMKRIMIARIKSVLHRAKSVLKGDPDSFLRHVSGVIHVGANTGQERGLYDKYGLRVIWIEPIPEVFATLQANVAGFSRQRAFQYLITDRDDAEYQFHVANNAGASSSVLDLNLHKDIWPQVAYERTITLRSKTLATVLKDERIEARDYDALIMDTQGSELLVLQGATPILQNFRYIKTEVPDFESYSGCCQLTDIAAFLTRAGYREVRRRKFAERAGGGSYYDIVYRRNA